MDDWYPPLVSEVRSVTQGDPFWESYLREVADEGALPFSLHLAILVEPYLRYLLEGSKTVESRFTMRRSPPYGRVNAGDVLLLKRSGGLIVGLCQVARTWFYRLDAERRQTIREEFAKALCADDPAFWQQRESTAFATLMQVQQVRRIRPIRFVKHDRRGWVVLRPGANQTDGRSV